MERKTDALPRMKILVAEDEPEQTKMLQLFLEHLGQEVVCAVNGDDAIHLFRETEPDLVLMDIMMPGIDGFEATGRMREMAGSAWVPVIYLTALQQRASVLAGLKAGGHDYLMKPIDFDVLEHKLRAIIHAIEVNNRLMAAEALLEMVFDPCENAALGFNEEGHIIACNEGAGHLLGRNCRALRGQRIAALLVGKEVPHSPEEWLARADGETRPVEIRLAEGGRKPLSMRLYSRPYRSRRVFLAVFEPAAKSC